MSVEAAEAVESGARHPHLSMHITLELAELIERHADQLGMTATEFVGRAISTEIQLQDALDEGYQVLLGKDDVALKELLLRPS